MNKSRKKHTQKSLATLSLLIAIFLIPLILAWILFSEHIHFGQGTNHGLLLRKPFSISTLNITDEKGDMLANNPAPIKPNSEKATTNGKWLLLYLYPGYCDQACQKGLRNMRQIRLATGKDMNRVQRAILTYQETALEEVDLLEILEKEFPGTKLLQIKRDQFEKVMDARIAQKTLPAYVLERGTIYMVDPMGNVMMVYKANSDPDGIFKDLKKVVKSVTGWIKI